MVMYVVKAVFRGTFSRDLTGTRKHNFARLLLKICKWYELWSIPFRYICRASDFDLSMTKYVVKTHHRQGSNFATHKQRKGSSATALRLMYCNSFLRGCQGLLAV